MVTRCGPLEPGPGRRHRFLGTAAGTGRVALHAAYSGLIWAFEVQEQRPCAAREKRGLTAAQQAQAAPWFWLWVDFVTQLPDAKQQEGKERTRHHLWTQ